MNGSTCVGVCIGVITGSRFSTVSSLGCDSLCKDILLFKSRQSSITSSTVEHHRGCYCVSTYGSCSMVSDHSGTHHNRGYFHRYPDTPEAQLPWLILCLGSKRVAVLARISCRTNRGNTGGKPEQEDKCSGKSQELQQYHRQLENLSYDGRNLAGLFCFSAVFFATLAVASDALWSYLLSYRLSQLRFLLIACFCCQQIRIAETADSAHLVLFSALS